MELTKEKAEALKEYISTLKGEEREFALAVLRLMLNPRLD